MYDLAALETQHLRVNDERAIEIIQAGITEHAIGIAKIWASGRIAVMVFECVDLINQVAQAMGAADRPVFGVSRTDGVVMALMAQYDASNLLVLIGEGCRCAYVYPGEDLTDIRVESC